MVENSINKRLHIQHQYNNINTFLKLLELLKCIHTRSIISTYNVGTLGLVYYIKQRPTWLTSLTNN